MKYIVTLFVLLLTSCKFQYISFNSESNNRQAKITADKYLKELKNKNEIENFNFISVENSKVVVGKCNDTLKEVYSLIYEIEESKNVKRKVLNLKKTKSKIAVSLKNID